MVLFLLVKESYHGGICNVAWRHCKANISGKPGYDSSKPSKYIFQLDVVSLYPYCMTFPFAVGKYKQLTQEEVEAFNPMNIDCDGKVGYLIKADFIVPIDKHDYFRDLPPLPEKLIIDKREASQFQKEFIGLDNIPSNFGKEQCLVTLYDKKGYVLFLPMLQQRLRLGLVVSKIHTIWSFKQKAFYKDTVDFYMTQRREAKSEGVKNTAKLSVNSSYGTFGIDQQKYKTIHLVTDEERALELIRQHNFGSFKIIYSMLSVVEMLKTGACMRHNLIVASAILDRSKALFINVLMH